MIFTSLSPNAERDDVLLALRLIFAPWKWKDGNATEDLEREFQEYQGAYHAIAANNGRTALFALLTAFKIGEDDEVLLQAYTCVAVPEPVLWAHAKPVYVDCTKGLTMDVEDFKKKITPKTRAVIVQHTFGYPAEIDRIVKIAHDSNIVVIEDCAHALGAEYKGKKLGTFGDAAFFSFGRDKAISSVFGGMITTNNSDVAARVEEVMGTFKKPGRCWIFRQLLHPIILAISKRLYSTFSIGRYFLAAMRKLGIISVAVEKIELSGGEPEFAFKQMPNALALLATNQFEKLGRLNTHRKVLADIYRDELAVSEIEFVKELENSSPIYLRYPIFLEHPENLVSYARRYGIELGNWYTESIAPARVNFASVGYSRDCQNAESLARQSCNLPTGIGTSESDAREVARVVREYTSHESSRSDIEG